MIDAKPTNVGRKADEIKRSVERYRPNWEGLEADERLLAASITIAVEVVGGRSDAAEIMGVGVSSIDNYRTGKRQPRVLEMMRLFHARDQVLSRYRSSVRAEINRAMIEVVPQPTDVGMLATFYGPDVTSALLPSEGEKPTNSGRLVSSFDPDADAGWSAGKWQPSVKGSIPEIDIGLGAGEGMVGEMINIPSEGGGTMGHRVIAEWTFPSGFLQTLGADPGWCVVGEVIGDSMVPTYQPGDRVLIDLRQTKLRADAVYAISDGFSEPQIKRLQRVPFSDPPRVKIISDNPALETFEAELERVQIIGRVIGAVTRK